MKWVNFALLVLMVVLQCYTLIRVTDNIQLYADSCDDKLNSITKLCCVLQYQLYDVRHPIAEKPCNDSARF